jgi:hypothetical protein
VRKHVSSATYVRYTQFVQDPTFDGLFGCFLGKVVYFFNLEHIIIGFFAKLQSPDFLLEEPVLVRKNSAASKTFNRDNHYMAWLGLTYRARNNIL